LDKILAASEHSTRGKIVNKPEEYTESQNYFAGLANAIWFDVKLFSSIPST
jgi:hypothetical protein